jgi:hypothetical protein
MSLIYSKKRGIYNISVLSTCDPCGKGMINIDDFRCPQCQPFTCMYCGRGYHNNKKSNECIPRIWLSRMSYEKTIICGLDLRIALTVLASAAREDKNNISCAFVILSYYYKSRISEKQLYFILEKYIFIKNNFFIL